MSLKEASKRAIWSREWTYNAVLRLWQQAAPIHRRLTAATTRRTRTVHAYCIGPPKAGTTSIAAMFSHTLGAAHEPYSYEFAGIYMSWLRNELTDEQMVAFLRQRDDLMQLDLEASHFLTLVPELLLATFPHSRFIIPVRDVYSWLESQINHEMLLRRGRKFSYWYDIFEAYFGPPPGTYPPGEAVLAEHGLASLAGYLDYWATTYSDLIRLVPPAQRLLVRTTELDNKGQAILDFLGVDAEWRPAGTRWNVRSNKIFSLKEINPEHLAWSVERHCGTTASLLDAAPYA